MATTITQARTLLTKPELELFDQSRAAHVKTFNVKQLDGKVRRARVLRDKYRDLYRRQRVASRGRAAAGRSEDDNARTQRKADVFEEVLLRLQAQLDKSEAQAARATGKVAAKPAKPARPARPAAKKAAAPKKTARTPRAPRAIPLKKAVKDALAAKLEALHDHGEHPDPIADAGADRSAKAPSRRSPAASRNSAVATAPLDKVARAIRTNPVKDRGGNIGIDAHTRVQVRRDQARRDHR